MDQEQKSVQCVVKESRFTKCIGFNWCKLAVLINIEETNIVMLYESVFFCTSWLTDGSVVVKFHEI